MWDGFDRSKVPLIVAMVSFVVVFLTTRTLTRLIRSGRARGPIQDTVIGGLHVHHAVLGILLLTAGGFMGLMELEYVWRWVAGFLVGAGASLVLDEFANILHLDDVYWRKEGRASTQTVALTVVCLGAVLVGFNPFGVDNLDPRSAWSRTAITVLIVASIVAVVICAMKGKYRFALVSIFIPFLSFIGAVRLARPDSPWASRFYNADKVAAATGRARRFDALTNPIWFRVGDFVAGAPSDLERPRPPSAADLVQLDAVRSAVDADLVATLDLPAAPSQALADADPATGFTLVAGMQVVGYTRVWDLDGHWHIAELAVHPRARTQGIGGILLTEVCEEVIRRGGSEVTVRTFGDLTWAAPYFARHGFLAYADDPSWLHPLVAAERDSGLLAAASRVSMVRPLRAPALAP